MIISKKKDTYEAKMDSQYCGYLLRMMPRGYNTSLSSLQDSFSRFNSRNEYTLFISWGLVWKFLIKRNFNLCIRYFRSVLR